MYSIFKEKRNMKLSYDQFVDALYIRLIEEPMECEVIQLNDWVNINIGAKEKVVGIEILDASEFLSGIKNKKIQLENLVAA